MNQLKITYTPVEDIKPYRHNAKIHSNEQIEQIRNSIEQFGFNDPIAIDEDNVIIEGHGRLLAAKEMGLETVPTIKIEGLTDQQKKAYILAHNQLTMNTGFDLDVLSDELERITDFNMDDFGVNLQDLSFIDTLLENEFGPGESIKTFTISLPIPTEHKDEVNKYIRENGKDRLIELVLEEVES